MIKKEKTIIKYIKLGTIGAMIGYYSGEYFYWFVAIMFLIGWFYEELNKIKIW